MVSVITLVFMIMINVMVKVRITKVMFMLPIHMMIINVITDIFITDPNNNDQCKQVHVYDGNPYDDCKCD